MHITSSQLLVPLAGSYLQGTFVAACLEDGHTSHVFTISGHTDKRLLLIPYASFCVVTSTNCYESPSFVIVTGLQC